MISYINCFESNKRMSFKISDKQLLKSTIKYGTEVKNLLNIEFDSETVYGDSDKYIKTKIKIYGGNVNKNFQGKKVIKEKASHKGLSLIMLYSVSQFRKNYYPATLLEVGKYSTKKAKMVNRNNDDFLTKFI